MRRHVGCVLVDDADAALDDLREALRGAPALIVIDGIDRFGGGQRDQATAMLQDAATVRPLAVFTTASDADLARVILAEAAWPASVIDLRPSVDAPSGDRCPLPDAHPSERADDTRGPRRTSDSTEVNA